jgi:hypothetical protein
MTRGNMLLMDRQLQAESDLNARANELEVDLAYEAAFKLTIDPWFTDA